MNNVYAPLEPARAEIDALNGPTLIEFGSPSCPHCRAAQALLAAALTDHSHVRHIKIEDDRDRPLGRSFGVKLWPTRVFLARFIVEIVEGLDLTTMERVYGTSSSAPSHPALLLSILVYGYATGVFSSRKLENATYDSIAFRFVAADEHPDHDTLNTFRKRFLKDIEALMVQVLVIARTMGVLKLGNIALDGSKIKANASRHSTLSYGHIKKQEEQLRGEVKKLMALAEMADNEKIPVGINLPDEIARREDRLKAIAAAKAKIEDRAKKRFEQEQADHQAKLDQRDAKSKQSGKPPRGKAPAAPVEGALDKDQVNLTDEQSRIMKVADGGFEQCYNSQLAVDMDSLLIVTTDTVQEDRKSVV